MPATTETGDGSVAGEEDTPAFDLNALLRPELEDLVAYVPHDPPGIEVKLDANEAPPSTSPEVREAVVRAVSAVALERYPDPRATRLREAIAKRTGARAEDLLVGTGSDEVIALLANAVARPRRRNTQAVIVTATPTFVMYRVTARGHGAKPVEVPLDSSWDLDVAMTKRAIELMQPSVVFIASPNNPTGNRMSEDRLVAIVDQAGRAGSLVVIDEAYVDYTTTGSLRRLANGRPHVVIMRTLSKIGLAALRIGWLEADGALVRAVDKVRQPYNTSAIAQAAAASVLEEAWDELGRDVAGVKERRTALAKAIGAIEGLSVSASEANFLWVKTAAPAEAVFDHLVADRILVRSFHNSGGRLATQLRITIGTDAEHDRLLASLAALSTGGAT